jgi:hypothetical protein
VQLYAPDDGRGDARNMSGHTRTSSNKLMKNSCILLADLFEPYDDARTREHQIVCINSLLNTDSNTTITLYMKVMSEFVLSTCLVIM